MAQSTESRNGFSRKIPAWYQLATLLRSEITSGSLPAGAQLDTELQLAEKYDLSVMPVRQALKSLEADGLITRQRGRGTFVRPGQKSHSYTALESLYNSEYATPARLIERGFAPPPQRFAEAFADHEDLAFVRRVVYQEALPWAYGTIYFLREFNDKIPTESLAHYPIYRLLEETGGLRVRRSNFTVRATAAPPDVAQKLDSDPFAAALHMTSLAYDNHDRPIGVTDMYFAGDRHALSFEVMHAADL